ncbi:MAG TPA: rhodanese-like domain-containing protein [Nitrospirota bacterium]|nr:rhodanese-like domain-containing protein [Nitrospirota bacterium]
MDIANYFEQIPQMPALMARDVLDQKSVGTYNLVDVRQPAEYEKGHLPGARLIPLAELASRLGEIDPRRPTIVYCRSGNRSRSAVGILLDAGFKDVFSMGGGISAWNGLMAGGPPDAGMAYFSSNEKTDTLIALAWALEEGSRRFYAGLAGSMLDVEGRALFSELTSAEERHKASLLALYHGSGGSGTIEPLFPGGAAGDVMEGGIRVSEALGWTAGRDAADILDLSIALESNAYDLYIKMERTVKDDHSKRVFSVLAEEEKRHLDRMTSLIEKKA